MPSFFQGKGPDFQISAHFQGLSLDLKHFKNQSQQKRENVFWPFLKSFKSKPDLTLIMETFYFILFYFFQGCLWWISVKFWSTMHMKDFVKCMRRYNWRAYKTSAAYHRQTHLPNTVWGTRNGPPWSAWEGPCPFAHQRMGGTLIPCTNTASNIMFRPFCFWPRQRSLGSLKLNKNKESFPGHCGKINCITLSWVGLG